MTSAKRSSAKPMVTVECWWCDEFQQRGPKKTGYCMQAMKPTWPSIYKACRDDARESAGDFCWNCCPFTDDNEGHLCGDEGPYVKRLEDCQTFKHRLNEALGGSPHYRFWYLNDKAEVVEVWTDIMHGVQPMVDDDLTLEFRWRAGWQRYYSGVPA